MNHPLKHLLITASPVLLGSNLEAEQPSPVVFRGRVSALESHSFGIGELRVQIQKFEPNRSFGASKVVFKLENVGSAFLAISAQDLAIVGRDGRQVLEASPRKQLGIHLLPQKLRLAPHAYVILRLYPDSPVEYPIKVYFGERLLAEITE